MKRYPKFVEVQGKKIPINTDFRIALECEKISRDKTIGEYEKICAIVYKLFGEEALKDHNYIFEFFGLAIKYLKCGRETVADDKDDKDIMFAYLFKIKLKKKFKNESTQV